jgi:hypothetical protein
MVFLARWFSDSSLPLLGLVMLAIVMGAAFLGYGARRLRWSGRGAWREQPDAQQEILLSAILGLLALLLGFTYSLAINRFEIRRELVLQEANAVGTAYLRAQLLEEPHRGRISKLLEDYAANRISLAKAGATRAMLARNDHLIVQLWAAEGPALESIKTLPFSISLLDAMNEVINMDAARKAARGVHIPGEVFVLLVLYMLVAAAALGYVLSGPRERVTAAILLALFTLALLLVIDIDGPTRGSIREWEGPMEQALAAMTRQPATP